MDKHSTEAQYLKRMMGKWYSWDSPVGLGIALVSLGLFVALLVFAGWLGSDIAGL